MKIKLMKYIGGEETEVFFERTEINAFLFYSGYDLSVEMFVDEYTSDDVEVLERFMAERIVDEKKICMNDDLLLKLTDYLERKNDRQTLKDDVNDINRFGDNWGTSLTENQRQAMFSDLIDLAINLE